jgi:hypothetical protein
MDTAVPRHSLYKFALRQMQEYERRLLRVARDDAGLSRLLYAYSIEAYELKMNRAPAFARRILLVSASLFAVFLGLTPAWSGALDTVEATQVTIFTPSLIRSTAREGRCWTTSIASPRAGAWRCMSGNSIYDPCFEPAGKGNAVVCGADPSEHKNGFTLTLTEPLPHEKVPPLKAPRPWIVELADGSRCRPYTGTMPLVAGLAISYYCQPPSARSDSECGLLGDFKADKIWTVTRIRYAQSLGSMPTLKLLSRTRVAVKAVWQ